MDMAMASSPTTSFLLHHPSTTKTTRRSFFRINHLQAIARKPIILSIAKASPPSSLGPDLFVLELAEKLEESISNPSLLPNKTLFHFRERSAEAALNLPWPTSKAEAYRFTDLKFLRNAEIETSPSPLKEDTSQLNLLRLELDKLTLSESNTPRLVFVDGVFSPSFTVSSGLPEGVFVGSLSTLPDPIITKHVSPRLGCSADYTNGDLFASLNGIGTQDLGIIIVPEGVQFDTPIHVVYYSSKGEEVVEEQAYHLSCPRLLVIAEKGARFDLVEEFVGHLSKAYWTNSVVELWIAEGANIGHSYVQTQGRDAVHMKQTFVAQSEGSSYSLVEAGIGSRLSRHNLHVEQLGPDTKTEMSSFYLAGKHQLQDLHSRVILNHPRGYARQLHKCIVMHSSGHGVFDGNVKVNRYAQQTDAGQLSRSLLLAPRATMNVKPNLQIFANDVKCSHGAAISDLEEDQLFYFRARGIDFETARSALVFSFGAQVTERLQHKTLRQRVETTVKGFLAAEGAVLSSISLKLP